MNKSINFLRTLKPSLLALSDAANIELLACDCLPVVLLDRIAAILGPASEALVLVIALLVRSHIVIAGLIGDACSLGILVDQTWGRKTRTSYPSLVRTSWKVCAC